MGMFRHTVIASLLTAGLAGCSSEAASPAPQPAASTPSAATPSTSSIDPIPPAAPKAAKEHTIEGAKAFVVYYWKAVDYSQATLDTTPVQLISDPNCVACQAGISALQTFARKHGRLRGGTETVSSLKVLAFKDGSPVAVSFELVSTAQKVIVPGQATILHPAGRNRKLMILIPHDPGWIAGELRSIK